MGSPLRSAIRVLGYGTLTFLLLPVQIAAVALGLPLATALPRFYHRMCCRILGFTVAVEGEPSSARPTLFVSNHVSYVDITVLGSLLPASFIAKAEISKWPLFGLLARLQRTVFIERIGARAAKHRDEMATRLADGDNLILFPEGTSDDGNGVLPFKSALFAVAERGVGDGGAALILQPVSIAYTRLDGMPLGRSLRPNFAWYGDMTLLPHLWEMLGLGVVTVQVIFHPPIDADALGSRKALADHCHRVVAGGVEKAISGRAFNPTPPLPEPSLALFEDRRS